VVGDDAVRRVDAVLVFLAQFTGIRSRSRELLDLGKERSKHVRVVIAGTVLKNRDETLEAHAGVDVFGGQIAELAIRFAVVLDKDNVPDFENKGIVLVDEMCGIPASDAVVMDFAVPPQNQQTDPTERCTVDATLPAGSAGPSSSHFWSSPVRHSFPR
jgi:hypothetical protein